MTSQRSTGRAAMGKRNADETPGLRRQSLLIALLCAAADGVLLVVTVTALEGGWSGLSPLVLLAGAIVVLSDFTLALPPRTAAGVAMLHGAVRVVSAALMGLGTGVPDLALGNAAGLAVAAYRSGAWSRGWWSLAALGALGSGLYAALLLQAAGGGPVDAALAVTSVVTVTNTLLPWLVGRYTTGRAGHIENIEHRAQEERRRSREEVAQAMAHERAAIARDLHDTISHHVSVIGIHAAAGRLALGPAVTGSADQGRAPATRALDQVETASSAAMADLRRMLDILATDDVDTVRQPGLADLSTLIDGSRSAGLVIDLATPGLSLQTVPPSLHVVSYRIIQELLTNALRHGDGTLQLVLSQDPFRLTITASNGLAAAQSGGTGRGLEGIAHRARMYGGDVRLDRAAGDGMWHVCVTLPLVTP